MELPSFYCSNGYVSACLVYLHNVQWDAKGLVLLSTLQLYLCFIFHTFEVVCSYA